MTSAPVVQSTIDRIVVLFGDVPHLSLPRDKLIGFQSWHEYDRSKFTIEWTCDGGVIVTEYDDAAKWSSILQQVNSLLGRTDQARAAARQETKAPQNI